ncbi:DNA polymerase III subunit delta' [Defluviimonas sp. 20V17]|uniref:DNA polymerase III subunit delta n=1 Tax=Allgaiera indica TaxID=765699 RepID=A0AAN4UT58_9RHOB|nr:DNA polymerase III subunit delta' [Allgaiera indica]KDB02325.1 DNA polymerase III subunit delta' [Defluviimonas sp. 20V17]GHE02886.1 DNA polymerase III subunit delta' [Allgaiera indica]SDX16329.1 DNA polymerase III, delta prime subunit [Allgaiera indica]
MSDDPTPEADRVEGAPHPRETRALIGQSAAEVAFLDAYRAGRLHHGWLITGPRGVGKATLAWRIARFLLAEEPAGDTGLFGAPPPPESLDIPDDHPVARRMAALSEGRLFLLRRAWDADKKRLKAQITVDEARKLKGFFGLSSADGGRRVVIVDAADEMNVSAANALLKLLEEPPANTSLLLVSHQPSRLLPTIRSRCRELRLTTLSPDDMAAALAAAGCAAGADTAALAELSAGAVGEAVRLTNLGGLEGYADLVRLFSDVPGLDRARAIRLAEACAGRGAEDRLDLTIGLIETFLARLARAGATRRTPPEAAAGEAALFARLAPDAGAARRWADLHQSLGAEARHGRAVNLDPAALVLDMILKIDEAAAGVAAH